MKNIKKKSQKTQEMQNEPTATTASVTATATTETTEQTSLIALKKRGRKPKGGKLVLKQNDKQPANQNIPNIILHLKCSLNDLNNYNDDYNKIVTNPLSYNPSVPPEIKTYNENEDDFYAYEKDKNQPSNLENFAYQEMNVSNNRGADVAKENICQKCKNNEENEKDEEDDVSLKTINDKLKKLKINLYKNNDENKKSACFWCTYEFDNQECQIPKYEMDGTISGYGSFCRPECAVAYLMKENIDDSTKFERYHLLNRVYGKIYKHKKNIRPAPSPYYLLDKYYGNLTIQEYRKLLKTEHLLLIIDKPLTRILPELHDDNEDFFFNICGNNNMTNTNQIGMYKVKKQSEKQNGPSKSSIIRNQFGL
jgi:hypothetical protein